MKPASKRRSVWHPPIYTKEDIRAIQAVAHGTAGEADQRRAIEWILHHAAGIREDTFVPENQYISAYVQGRRSVGLAIAKLMTLKPEIFENE